MNQDDLRRRVWEEMLKADMRSNYFAELVRRYQSLEKGLRVATLVASSGAAATVLTSSPDLLRLGLPVTASIASFWLLLSDYGRMSRDATELHGGWSATQMQYERLWNSLEDSSAESRFHQINDAADKLSASGAKFPNKKSRLSYWLDHAAAEAQARYA